LGKSTQEQKNNNFAPNESLSFKSSFKNKITVCIYSKVQKLKSLWGTNTACKQIWIN